MCRTLKAMMDGLGLDFSIRMKRPEASSIWRDPNRWRSFTSFSSSAAVRRLEGGGDAELITPRLATVIRCKRERSERGDNRTNRLRRGK